MADTSIFRMDPKGFEGSPALPPLEHRNRVLDEAEKYLLELLDQKDIAVNKKLQENLKKGFLTLLNDTAIDYKLILDSIYDNARNAESIDVMMSGVLLSIANENPTRALEIIYHMGGIKSKIESKQETKTEQDAQIDEKLQSLDKVSYINFSLSDLTQKLFEQENFQGAMNLAVANVEKAETKDQIIAFSLIRGILKATPSNKVLFIKDKKILPSERTKWIEKMDQNLEEASSEFDKEYKLTPEYSNMSLTGDTLKVYGGKEKSEKKLRKELSKELHSILRNLNEVSAFRFIDNNYNKVLDAVGEKKSLSTILTTDFLQKNGYVSKNKKNISNGEVRAMIALFDFKLKANHEQDEDAIGEYDYFERAAMTGTSLGEIAKAESIIAQALDEKDNKKAIKVLLGDWNRDGKVTVTPEDSDSKKPQNVVDEGILFGGQVVRAFDNSLTRFGEAHVVKNIVDISKQLLGLEDFTLPEKEIVITTESGEESTSKEIDYSFQALLQAWNENPLALIKFREKLLKEPDAGSLMFEYGKDYATEKIDRIRYEDKLREKVENFLDNTPEGKKLLSEATAQAMKSLKENLQESKPKLEKTLDDSIRDLKSSITKDLGSFDDTDDLESFITQNQTKLSDETKVLWEKIKELKILIKDISEEDGIKFLKQSENLIAAQTKNLLIGVGVGAIHGQATHTVFDQEGNLVSKTETDLGTNLGLGAGVSFSPSKLNEWIRKTNFLEAIVGGVGLGISKNGIGLGFSISLKGKTIPVGENAVLYYSPVLGYNPLNRTRLSLGASVGAEYRTNKTKLTKTLSRNAAKSQGDVIFAGVNLDLKDGGDVSLASYTHYWKRDKDLGSKERVENIKNQVTPVFAEILKDKNLTLESIANKLRDIFKNSEIDDVFDLAIAMYNMVVSYKQIDDTHSVVIDRLSKDFADFLSQGIREKDMKEILKEGIHISQLGIGASASLMNLMKGFFINGGIVLSKYSKGAYVENQESIEQVRKGLNIPDYYVKINNQEGIPQKLETVNKLLGGDYLKYHSGTKADLSEAYIELTADTFDQKSAIELYCHPDLAPYVHQDQGILKIPHNADISLGKVMRQGKEERFLILGAQSAQGCKKIQLGEVNESNQNPKPIRSDQEKTSDQEGETLAQNSVEFGTKEIDSYKSSIRVEHKSIPVSLDKKTDKDLADLLRDNGDVLVDFRSSNPNYKKFIELIEEPESRANGVQKFVDLLPTELQDLHQKDPFTMDEIRFIYASLSRVSQTRDKQLTENKLGGKASEYLEKISTSNREKLKEFIKKVAGSDGVAGEALTDSEWREMARMLGINIESDRHKNFSASPSQKLFHILTPIDKLAQKRTEVYERKLKSEYQTAGLPEGAQAILKARNESLEKIKNMPTATGNFLGGYVGAVAGYDLENEIRDKFVGYPKIIDHSLVEITGEGAYAVKYHYLDEMSRQDKAQFDYLKKQLLDQLRSEPSEESDQILADELAGMKDIDFIKAILDTKFVDGNGEEIDENKFETSAFFAFFADCINETILFANFKIKKTTRVREPAPSDIYYYDNMISNHADLTRKDVLALGAVVGEVMQSTEHGTDPNDPLNPGGGNTIPNDPLDPGGGNTIPGGGEIPGGGGGPVGELDVPIFGEIGDIPSGSTPDIGEIEPPKNVGYPPFRGAIFPGLSPFEASRGEKGE